MVNVATRLGVMMLFLLMTVGFYFLFNIGRNETKNIDVQIIDNKKYPLKVGFSAIKTTPKVPDRWIDKDENYKYNHRKGDTFIDGNNNGVFDPVWIAGFGNARAANGVHDDLWARTMVIESGPTRLAIVSLDAIGFMNPEVNDVRKMLPADLNISYLIVSSTHTHEGPDLLGLWGKSPFRSGIDLQYMDFVKSQIVKSVTEATQNLEPAIVEVSEELTGAQSLLTDTRKPDCFDSGLRMLRIKSIASGATLGTMINWGNHPETLWSNNLFITSDFPHYFREGVEKGVFNGDSLYKAGTGGICLYITGAVGGLMTTHPRVIINDPLSGKEFKDPSFEKAEAQGKNLSLLALNAMENPAETIDSAAISVCSRSFEVKLKNRLFKLGLFLGVFYRNEPGTSAMTTEVAVCKIGPVSIVTFPGEVYPEIVNGPVEAPEGNDFKIQPVETPPIRDLMPGKYKFVFGLANDEIGYIIPKSQWDAKAPFTYGRNDSPYGEENSVGPDTAPEIYRNLKELLLKIRD
jgi:hypothetical protein